MIEDWQHGGFGLYVHWPFCESLCPYCDFNSYVSNSIDHAAWASALVSEIERNARDTQGRALRSVYFGGGTPSLMAPSTVEAMLKSASDVWPFANDIEITLEANPSSVEADKFRAFRDAGINRVSLGVQALNDPDLKALGRRHSVSEARAALETAQSLFDRVSFDLIYARQNQSLDDWEKELTEALSFGTDHLSLYQLTIEQGTAFGDRFAKGALRGLPSEDLSADMFFLTQDLTAGQGRPAYETSNHAAPGQESQHNQIYWRNGDFVGVGPGAHGRVTINETRYATETHLHPDEWLDAVNKFENGESDRAPLSFEDKETEMLLMCLRLYDGVLISRFQNPEILYKIKDLVEINLIELHEDKLRLTPSGRPLLNSILNQLV
ncbi:radical SAM family heme chaperone HemW [Cognatiyoonia sp.]|uniref:radical SAM family heme chaperone HemW n=1 Tax=Cognatiyoonia sp. TaxID=2211652 RepID=UPI003F69D4C1